MIRSERIALDQSKIEAQSRRDAGQARYDLVYQKNERATGFYGRSVRNREMKPIIAGTSAPLCPEEPVVPKLVMVWFTVVALSMNHLADELRLVLAI
jgi:hypothetical protein